MKFFLKCASFAALLSLAACAAQPEIPYDHTAAQDNKTIGLLTPGWPSGPSSVLASDIGQSFGLVGALVDSAMMSNREKDLTKILSDQKLDANLLFISSLTDKLQKEGYVVVPISAEQKRIDFLKTYPPGSTSKANSYLDIAVIDYGYIAAGIAASDPYRPWLVARVKLVRVSDGDVLMQDIVSYNPLGAPAKMVTISPDPAYAFATWDTLTADPQNATKGISVSLDQSAATIANLVK